MSLQTLPLEIRWAIWMLSPPKDEPKVCIARPSPLTLEEPQEPPHEE